MKAFKYLVFLFLLFFSVSSYANWKRLDTGATTSIGYSPSGACVHFGGIDFASSYGQDTYFCYIGSRSGPTFKIQMITGSVCPSATTKDLKVPTNSKSYVCVEQCQYKLRGCVDVDIEPGMTCTAISTGQDCGTPPPPTNDPNSPPTATPDPADPNGSSSQNTANSQSTSNSTSTSTSTSSTENNTNITNTTTNTITNTTTNTIINLDRLEDVIKNMTSVLSNKLDAILGKIDQDGGTDGGTGEGTDLTDTNAKLDENNSLLSDIKDWLTGEGDGSNGTGGDNPFGNDAVPEKQLTEQTFQTNLFSGSAACPSDRTLSFTLFTGRSFSRTFSFAMWCDKLQIFGYFILIASYLYGALIITRNS